MAAGAAAQRLTAFNHVALGRMSPASWVTKPSPEKGMKLVRVQVPIDMGEVRLAMRNML